jgi:hypothetical protein
MLLQTIFKKAKALLVIFKIKKTYVWIKGSPISLNFVRNNNSDCEMRKDTFLKDL